MMPEMDGYELLQYTRESKHLRTLPFIFLTAKTSPSDQRLAMSIGIEDYLTKPVDEKDLVLAIQNAIRRRKDMQEEMEWQMDVLRNQIVGMLQHEFRTPLTFVLGYAEYLQEMMDGDIAIDDLRTATSGILEGGYRLQRLIEGFLMLAEVLKKKMQPDDLESLNAFTVVQNAATDSYTKIEKEGLSLKVLTQNNQVRIIGESSLLHEAIKRMLDNTIQYKRSQSKHVWLSIEQHGTYVGLRVRDEGMGIPPETVEQLSRPFAQGDRSDRTQPGAGLSLALVHHIASLHGGRLQIESKLGAGSTFTLWIPASASATNTL
ncbi:HAMP domain-containing histidine kinase [Chloroflexi bacterium TSY]|nr:HAMP domain-containing histidine kinase [Chloroflexi bacterium TSY]